MTTRIKVTLDTDQWARVYALVGDRIKGDELLGRLGSEEVRREIRLAAEGTGEGERWPGECFRCGDIHDSEGEPDEYGNRFMPEFGLCNNCLGVEGE